MFYIPQPRDEMHSYSPSTQALLQLLLLLLLPSHAMSQRDSNTLEGMTANYRCAIRLVLPPSGREGNLPPRSYLGCIDDCITNLTHTWKH